MQPEGDGAAICIFELRARIASLSPLLFLLLCCEVLLFYRLVLAQLDWQKESCAHHALTSKARLQNDAYRQSLIYSEEKLSSGSSSCSASLRVRQPKTDCPKRN